MCAPSGAISMRTSPWMPSKLPGARARRDGPRRPDVVGGHRPGMQDRERPGPPVERAAHRLERDVASPAIAVAADGQHLDVARRLEVAGERLVDARARVVDPIDRRVGLVALEDVERERRGRGRHVRARRLRRRSSRSGSRRRTARRTPGQGARRRQARVVHRVLVGVEEDDLAVAVLDLAVLQQQSLARATHVLGVLQPRARARASMSARRLVVYVMICTNAIGPPVHRAA